MSDCNHSWLVPSSNKTTCKKCGRDGYIYLDVDPTDKIQVLQDLLDEEIELKRDWMKSERDLARVVDSLNLRIDELENQILVMKVRDTWRA